jgi:hypothetical protein
VYVSYLSNPRITFSGQFQADVSTVNNDPRHFDSSTFEDRFQEFSTAAGTQNGWWNPIGTGIFRLAGCKITTAVGPGGCSEDGGVLGWKVGNSPDRPSAKLVDIDPDWQLASQIYGMEISLVDSTGRLVLVATFDPAPFRDLWFTRGGGSGDSGASAYWQTELSDLRWDLPEDAPASLRALAEHAAASGRLSLRITTFACQVSVQKDDFTYGSIVGTIGPILPDEPRTCLIGRRFMPNGANVPSSPGLLVLGGNNNNSVATNGMSCFNAQVVGDSLLLDTANSLPFDDTGKLVAQTDVHVALLKRPEITEIEQIYPDDYIDLGLLDSSHDGLYVRGGIQEIALSEAALALIGSHPLALVKVDSSKSAVVIMREQPGGYDIKADLFSFRLDPNHPERNHRDVPMYATRYGSPLPGATVTFQPTTPVPDIGDSPTDKTAGTTPRAAVPIMNTPAGAIHIDPKRAVTGPDGRAVVKFRGPPHMGNPRQYIDGQLYAINYTLEHGAPIMQTFDQISVLVFSSFDVPEQPGWSDVQPILKQYANLYPIMSLGLFDFSVQKIADANAHLLYFVFDKKITDPDQMPVTRDLSWSKRQSLLRYFASVMDSSALHALTSEKRVAARCPFSGVGLPASDPETAPVSNIPVFSRLRSE